MDTSGRVSSASVPGKPGGRAGVHAYQLAPLVAFVGLAAVLAGCGGSSSPAGSTVAATAPGASHSVTSPSSGAATARDACALVSAADLASLGVTGAGRALAITRGPSTTYSCTWGHPPGRELHLQVEPLDPAAASQVRVSLAGQGVAVPGVGGGARGQFGSVLAQVNFFKANTRVGMILFGAGVGGRKGAFIAVAKNVAGRL